jgi:hypothetical protein
MRRARSRGASTWAGAVVAGLACCLIVAGGAGATPRQADVPAFSVAYIVGHPCALLTLAQAEAAAKTKFGPAQQIVKTGLCEYDNAAGKGTINLYLTLGTAKSALPPTDLGNTYHKVSSLGHGATWVVESHSPKGSGELFFTLGTDGKNTYNVQIELSTGGLDEATRIAKDCIGHL